MATTSFTDNSTLIQASWLNDVDTLVYGGLTSPSGTNTITATGPASMTAYAARQLFWFIPANTNTGATTINIMPSGSTALGAKNIFCGGAACVGGEIVASVPCLIMYDGTQLNIIGPLYALKNTYTGTATGMTTSPTGVFTYQVLGQAVILTIPAISGTSNATTFTVTGAPAVIRPAVTRTFLCRTVDNSGAILAAQATMGTDGTITFYKDADATAFTGSGTKQCQNCSVTYLLGS